MGDASKGKVLFTKFCLQCHTIEPGGKSKLGPNLFGVIGKTSGSSPNFAYTDAMKNKKVKWEDTSLDDYLQQPKKYVPGTKMMFAGLKKPEDRKDIIAYMKTLK